MNSDKEDKKKKDQEQADDLSARLASIENDLAEIKKKMDEDGGSQNVKRQIQEITDRFRSHQHTGDDGSEELQYNIDLKAGQTIGAGKVGAATGIQDVPTLRTFYTFATGTDQNAEDGSDNAQVYLEHQYGTNGGTNQTFFYGLRSPIFIGGPASVISGESKLSQSVFSWEENELVGIHVTVGVEGSGTFNQGVITSNTATQFTVDTAWTFTANNARFTAFVPIYLGAADYPWRRVYTTDGTAGGVRFGYGPTGGGDNGLLYMDAAGDLYWREPDGTATKLN